MAKAKPKKPDWRTLRQPQLRMKRIGPQRVELVEVDSPDYSNREGTSPDASRYQEHYRKARMEQTNDCLRNLGKLNLPKKKTVRNGDHALKEPRGYYPADENRILEMNRDDLMSFAGDSRNRRQILELMADGFSNADIAKKMDSPIKTIQSRVYKIKENIGETLSTDQLRYHAARILRPDRKFDESKFDLLTARELELLRMYADGTTSGEIAKRIHRTKKAIESHRWNIISKLGFSNWNETFSYLPAIKKALERYDSD